MPFGLSNSAQTLQPLMNTIFGPKLEPYIFIYLDDIILVTSTFEEHIKLLQLIKDWLKAAGLTVNLDKCELFKSNLMYSGYIFDFKGFRSDPDKMSSMGNYPRPTIATEVKSFLGFCFWYRRFVQNFYTITASIN